MTRIRPLLVRDLHSGAHLDLFFVAAVASVLLIRFYLRLTGYPQIGGATLHVAHLLWGGLLMLAALVLSLAFLGRASRRWAALLGGIGFGAFIDEVGKFVTRDNDYFYRPAIALIYVVFVAIYLALRSLRAPRRVTAEAYVVNALQELEQAAIHDLQEDERARALRYLAYAERQEPGVPLAAPLAAVVRQLAPLPSRRPGLPMRAARGLLLRYGRLTQNPLFWRALVVFFAAQLALKLLHAALVVWRPETGVSLAARVAFLTRFVDGYALADWLQLGSSLVSAVLVAGGIAMLRRSRRRALALFHDSLLVSVFVTQVFMFYTAQLAAIVVLAFNLVVLVGVGYMRRHEDGAGPAAGPPP